VRSERLCAMTTAAVLKVSRGNWPMTQDATPQQIPDAELVRRYVAAGDADAMGELFARHADAAFRLALRFAGRTADAEDAVQTAFLDILKHAGSFRTQASARAWIMGFIVNACRHQARGNIRRETREREAQRETVEPEQADPAINQAVRGALAGLPE